MWIEALDQLIAGEFSGSDAEFCRVTGLTTAHLSSWRRHSTMRPHRSTIQRIEHALHLRFRFDADGSVVGVEQAHVDAEAPAVGAPDLYAQAAERAHLPEWKQLTDHMRSQVMSQIALTHIAIERLQLAAVEAIVRIVSEDKQLE